MNLKFLALQYAMYTVLCYRGFMNLKGHSLQTSFCDRSPSYLVSANKH